jgi:hypothetical protein
MSIDLYMEDEEGAALGEVLDPDDLTSRIVALAAHGGTACLRFVHPEGNTVFNQFQIPTLIRELEAARDHITDERLTTLGLCELASAREARWAPSVIHAIEVRNQKVQTADVLAHLEQMIELAEQTRGKAHKYLKFYGD